MSFTQYLKDTQAELRHVAWPTQTQTILYTVFVVLFSVGISVYLGLFDFLFTSSLSRIVGVQTGTPVESVEVATTTPEAPVFSTSTPGN
jgi:preprotein translocase SecE subunit